MAACLCRLLMFRRLLHEALALLGKLSLLYLHGLQVGL